MQVSCLNTWARMPSACMHGPLAAHWSVCWQSMVVLGHLRPRIPSAASFSSTAGHRPSSTRGKPGAAWQSNTRQIQCMLDDFNCNINSLLVFKCPQRITKLVGMIVSCTRGCVHEGSQERVGSTPGAGQPPCPPKAHRPHDTSCRGDSHDRQLQ